MHEVGHADPLRDVAADAFDLPGGEAQHEHGALAERLAGNGPPVDAGAADHVLALHQGHPLVQAGRLDRRALPPRARLPAR